VHRIGQQGQEALKAATAQFQQTHAMFNRQGDQQNPLNGPPVVLARAARRLGRDDVSKRRLPSNLWSSGMIG